MTLKYLFAAVSLLTSVLAAQEQAQSMAWQRNLPDALAMSERTGKPLLVCVNMDGEVACERIASGRYHDPEFIALADHFVAVLASPNRHTTSDYDEQGRRVPCPKYGRLTCGEHIDIDPVLYEKYFAGRRVAPRHLGVSSEGEIMFDLFLLQRLGYIDETLAEHAEKVEASTPDYAAMDLIACLDFTDHDARVRVELAFIEGDESARLALVLAALSSKVEHPELLALALKDASTEVRDAALDALAQTSSVGLLHLFIPALALCEGPQQHTPLLAALGRIAVAAPSSGAPKQHKFLGGVHSDSVLLKRDAWLAALASDPGEPDVATADDDLDALDAELGQLSSQSPPTVPSLLGLARVNLHFGRVLALRGSNPTYLFEDARSAASLALELEPESGLAHAYIAQVAYLLGEEGIDALSAQAVALLEPGCGDGIAAAVLGTFAKARTQTLYSALGRNVQDWPESWISDINDAYLVLSQHAAAGPEQLAAHISFLAYIEAFAPEGRALEAGLQRFPSASSLHQRLRTRLLREGGPGQLDEQYRKLLIEKVDHAGMNWFAGYASIVAAEQWVGLGETSKAIECYGKSMRQFARCVELEPSFRGSSVHFVCLALAGRGRLYLESKRYEVATSDLYAAVNESPGSVEWEDGLGNTPRRTALLLRRVLREDGHDALADDLERAWAEKEVLLDTFN
jgi:tetratricopeptide (TPR) repeat protein